MVRLRKFFLLAPTERRLFLQAGTLLAAVRLGLFLLPFPTLCRFLVYLQRILPSSTQFKASCSNQVFWSVATAGQYIPKATCLSQALVVRMLLERAGIPCRLYIGVARDNSGGLEAHAWVESQGQVFLGDVEPSGYTSLPGLMSVTGFNSMTFP